MIFPAGGPASQVCPPTIRAGFKPALGWRRKSWLKERNKAGGRRIAKLFAITPPRRGDGRVAPLEDRLRRFLGSRFNSAGDFGPGAGRGQFLFLFLGELHLIEAPVKAALLQEGSVGAGLHNAAVG